MSYFTYTYEEFVEAVKTSISKREVLRKLGLSPHGGNYRTFNNFVKKHNIDTSHFKGAGWAKNVKFRKKFETSVYLNNEKPISSYKLKKGYYQKIFLNINVQCVKVQNGLEIQFN